MTQLSIVSPVDEVLLDITVPGTPKGAMRPRSRIIHSKPPVVQVYQDPDDVENEDRIAALVTAAWRGRPLLDEAVSIEIETWHARPEKLKRKRDAGDGPRMYVGKPDADNVAKLVMDALTWDQRRWEKKGIGGIWTNDTRVADLVVRRRYLPLDERSVELGVERTEVRVRRATT